MGFLSTALLPAKAKLICSYKTNLVTKTEKTQVWRWVEKTEPKTSILKPFTLKDTWFCEQIVNDCYSNYSVSKQGKSYVHDLIITELV